MRHHTLRKTSSDRPSPPVFPGQAAVIMPLLLLVVLRPAGTLVSLNCTTETITILTQDEVNVYCLLSRWILLNTAGL